MYHGKSIVSCTASLSSCSSWDDSVVPVVAMWQRSFAVTGDRVVTTCGFVSLADAGDRCSTGQLGNSDNGNLHKARDLGKSLSLSILLFQWSLSYFLYVTISLPQWQSEAHITCHYVLRPLKHFSAVLGKSTYEQWLYLPEKWFLGKPLLCSKEGEEKRAVH